MGDYVFLEFLVEDPSGKILLNKILDLYKQEHANLSCEVHSFKGIGRLPKRTDKITDVKTAKLLNDLPIYLKGFDASLASSPYRKAIIVIVDNDDKNCVEFKNELSNLAQRLDLNIDCIFCIAVEEMEAWLLGDINAVIAAFPNAKKRLLQDYQPDSIIGTWGYLADTVYSGGVAKLKKDATSYYEIGEQKCFWADKIGAALNLWDNRSPSFNHLLSKLDTICGQP